MGRYKEIDLSQIKIYSGVSRKSKVNTALETSQLRAGMTMKDFLASIPDLLKAKELKEIAKSIVQARKTDKPVIAMLGGHVIKTGCSSVISDLIRKGYISHLASNGSAAIHDVELSLLGHTSEDVDAYLEDGSFGMSTEAADLLNEAASIAYEQKLGLGEGIGRLMLQKDLPFLERSLFANCYNLAIPCTLHVALGTDIVHQHRSAHGAAIGETSLRDFRIFAHTVSQLGDGGVVLNFGSAVIMPEVFLKALSVARNIQFQVKNFTTANFDMIQHYRPNVNVVKRPVLSGGSGYSITGHHEIMIPLLAVVVYEEETNSKIVHEH